MIRITETIERILEEDGFTAEVMHRRLLNNTAYAKTIHRRVEEKALKPVKLGTIVVALTRIAKRMQQQPSFTPKIVIDTFGVTSSISEITYDVTERSLEELTSLKGIVSGHGAFFTVTKGLHEITILCSQTIQNEVICHFSVRPKVVLNDLIAVSLRFSSKYMDVPNTIYALVSILAARHINIIEVVSTYTELTFVITNAELEKTIETINVYMKTNHMIGA